MKPPPEWIEKWSLALFKLVEVCGARGTSRALFERHLTAIHREVYDEAYADAASASSMGGITHRVAAKARRETLEEVRRKMSRIETGAEYKGGIPWLGLSIWLAEQLSGTNRVLHRYLTVEERGRR